MVRLAWDRLQWCGLLLRPRESLEAEILFLLGGASASNAQILGGALQPRSPALSVGTGCSRSSREGYLHGINTVTEAVLQIQGRGGARQVKKNDCCLVTSAAMMDGSALILTKDG